MAIDALRDYAVDKVAGRAEKERMFTLVILELGYLLGMTAQARVCYIIAEGDLQGGMRILVAI
jgi:hypothetical protein